MKLFASSKYFSEMIAPVTILNYLLGLRTFEYPRGHLRLILSLIYSLLLYGLYYNGSLTMEETFYADVELLKLEYVLYKLLGYVIMCSVIVKILLGLWYSERFKVCHKMIFKIDETLRQLGSTVNYDRIYFVIIGTIIIWFTFAFIMCTAIYIYLRLTTYIFQAIYVVVAYTFGLSVNCIIIFEFYIFVICLQKKFESVNRLLHESLTSTKEMKLGMFEMKDYAIIMDTEQRKHLSIKMLFRWRRRVQSRINVSKKPDSVVYQIPSHFGKQFQNRLRNRSPRHNPVMMKCQKHKHLLQTIKQVHLELCKVSKILCTILGVQTAWELGVTIMVLTGVLYNLYVRYTAQHKVKHLAEQTTFMLVTTVLHVVKTVFLTRACKNATDEGNKTIEIIHTTYGCDADVDMQEEIQQFGIQILQSPVTFSAFGLTLDNRVLSMILKTVTIYIVIMIQVSNTLESNNAIQYSHF